MRKRILHIDALIVRIGKTYKLPQNTVYSYELKRKRGVPFYILKGLGINFTTHFLVIVYIPTFSAAEEIEIENIFDVINAYTGVSKRTIRGKGGKDKVAFARQLFHYCFYKLGFGSQETTAAVTNTRNHSSVLHSIKQVQNALRYGTPKRKSTAKVVLTELGLSV